jgi:hypothetical protein
MNKGVFFGIGLKGSTAPVIPVLQSAVIRNNLSKGIFLTFDSVLDALIIPDDSCFVVKVNGEIRENMFIDEIDQYQLSLFHTSILFAYGDIITVSYTAPEINPLQGVDGGLVESFVDYLVTNNIEAP